MVLTFKMKDYKYVMMNVSSWNTEWAYPRVCMFSSSWTLSVWRTSVFCGTQLGGSSQEWGFSKRSWFRGKIFIYFSSMVFFLPEDVAVDGVQGEVEAGQLLPQLHHSLNDGDWHVGHQAVLGQEHQLQLKTNKLYSKILLIFNCRCLWLHKKIEQFGD